MICHRSEPVDVVEPPKHITARHVSAVFEKMGYDPAAGGKVFGVLLELLAQEKLRLLEEESEEQDGAGGDAATTTSTGSGGGNSSSADYDDEEVPTRPSERQIANEGPPPAPLYARKPRASFTSSLTFSSGAAAQSNGKMDVSDFIKAVEIDDVLVQAMSRRARQKMQQLMRTAEEQYVELQRLPLSQQKYTSSMEIATDMLSEEFRLAFQQLKGGISSKPSNGKLFP